MPRIASIADTRTLSDLLSGLELRGQSWCYTNLGPHAGFSVPPGEAVLFHAVLHGSARIACASGEVAVLEKGDVAVVLSGEAHALRTSPESEASTHEFLREDRAVDIPPTVMLGNSGTVCARVLSGRLRPNWPGEVCRSTLPPLLRFRQEDGDPVAALLRPEALALSGMG
ncbi:MAG: cupin domain-containing protein, partial [Novosphingobium sp.]|nr:cupin domain-containing protein [Novosphingobium sp.]